MTGPRSRSPCAAPAGRCSSRPGWNRTRGRKPRRCASGAQTPDLGPNLVNGLAASFRVIAADYEGHRMAHPGAGHPHPGEPRRRTCLPSPTPLTRARSGTTDTPGWRSAGCNSRFAPTGCGRWPWAGSRPGTARTRACSPSPGRLTHCPPQRRVPRRRRLPRSNRGTGMPLRCTRPRAKPANSSPSMRPSRTSMTPAAALPPGLPRLAFAGSADHDRLRPQVGRRAGEDRRAARCAPAGTRRMRAGTCACSPASTTSARCTARSLFRSSLHWFGKREFGRGYRAGASGVIAEMISAATYDAAIPLSCAWSYAGRHRRGRRLTA